MFAIRLLLEKLINLFSEGMPTETQAGTVELTDHQLIYLDKDGQAAETVCLANLDHIYLYRNSGRKPFLYVFDDHQHFIPIEATQFKPVYSRLAAAYGFSDDLSFFDRQQAPYAKKQLWRRAFTPTYLILPDPYDDYGDGFEIQAPRKQFISWDTTYADLRQNEHVRLQPSTYGQQQLAFAFPVRVGRIILYNMACTLGYGREDVAVRDFYATCYDEAGSDRSYRDLQDALLATFVKRPRQTRAATDFQVSNAFAASGINLSITYWFDSDQSFRGSYTHFAVENQRPYEHLLIDEDYEHKLNVSAYVLLSSGITTSSDYKRSERVKRKPPALDQYSTTQPIIWRDDINQKIGFADLHFAQVFDRSELAFLRIQNILPAKGGGAGYLEIYFAKGDTTYAILAGQTSCFDAFADQIQAVTGKNVSFGEAYYDY